MMIVILDRHAIIVGALFYDHVMVLDTLRNFERMMYSV